MLNELAESFWQSLQWQQIVTIGSATSSYLIFPHWHRPVAGKLTDMAFP
jgi:hypothetical protein